MSGDDDFDAFYRGTRDRLLGLVFVVTGDLAEAQDAVQDAYVRAWQRLGLRLAEGTDTSAPPGSTGYWTVVRVGRFVTILRLRDASDDLSAAMVRRICDTYPAEC